MNLQCFRFSLHSSSWNAHDAGRPSLSRHSLSFMAAMKHPTTSALPPFPSIKPQPSSFLSLPQARSLLSVLSPSSLAAVKFVAGVHPRRSPSYLAVRTLTDDHARNPCRAHSSTSVRPEVRETRPRSTRQPCPHRHPFTQG